MALNPPSVNYSFMKIIEYNGSRISIIQQAQNRGQFLAIVDGIMLISSVTNSYDVCLSRTKQLIDKSYLSVALKLSNLKSKKSAS